MQIHQPQVTLRFVEENVSGQIVPLAGAFHHTPRTFRAALAFLASGAFPFERLLTHEVGLEGVAALFDAPPEDYLKAVVRP